MSPTDKHTGTTPRSGMYVPAASPPTGLPPALGGPRALLDGGAPPLVFVVVNAVVGAQATTRPTALLAAVAAAAATGLGTVALRLLRKETPRQALGGLAGLTIAVIFAVASGEARGYFLPGMLVDAAYGLVFAGSALVGYPLVGTVYGLLYRRRDWRDDPRLQRLFVLATLGWSGVFAVRAGVQILFYREDLPGLLAASKLLLGWPLTLLAAALTLAAVRHATAPQPAQPWREHRQPCARPPRTPAAGDDAVLRLGDSGTSSPHAHASADRPSPLGLYGALNVSPARGRTRRYRQDRAPSRAGNSSTATFRPTPPTTTSRRARRLTTVIDVSPRSR